MDIMRGQIVVYIQDDIIHVGTVGNINHAQSLLAIQETGHLIHTSHVVPNARIHIKGGA